MENILEIKKLNLFFDKYQALYNVDLTLKKRSHGSSGRGNPDAERV